MLTVEVHRTTAQSLASWGVAVVAVAAILGTYTVMQMYDDNIALRSEVAAMKARGCPSTVAGKRFVGSRFQAVDLSRPGFTSLACYYKAGMAS